MLKDYCHTIGLCFAGVLIYTAVLWFSLVVDRKNYPHDIILYHCSRFIIVGAAVSILCVSIVFLNKLIIETRQKHRTARLQKLKQQKANRS